jgi:hemerythrin-like domain-containing protein
MLSWKGKGIIISCFGEERNAQGRGPIARMLFEHEITRHLTNSLRKSADLYISTGQYDELLADIENTWII